MNLSNLTIKAKLNLAFGTLFGVMLVIAGVSLATLAGSNRQFQAFVNGANARTTLAKQVQTAVDERAIAARNLVLVTKPEDVEKEKAVVTKAHAEVGTRLGRLTAAIVDAKDVSDKGRALVAEMAKVEAAYGPVALAIVDLALNQKKEQAIARMNDECRPLLAQLSKVSADYADDAEAHAAALVAEAADRYAQQRNLIVLVCMLAAGVAIAASVLVTRSIIRPVAQALRLAEAVAAGDLTRGAQAQGKDELSALLRALNQMNTNLSAIVQGVRQGSESIASGSAEIATGNTDLSERTERQASSLQQTAATMDELSATVRNNADNAMQANQLAANASGIASKGGEVVEQVVQRMRGINDSSKKIADIISVIDGIAFQTNILALNAAVEAARAGEQGRGFAVVASEVRSLAQRSAAAAKEIKTLISASVEQVSEGSSLAEGAGKTMNEIVAAIRRVSDIVAEISTASAEQSAGVVQVNEAVSEMDRATQQNAALVEQSAAAAESLQGQAAQLVQAVAVFKV